MIVSVVVFVVVNGIANVNGFWLFEEGESFYATGAKDFVHDADADADAVDDHDDDHRDDYDWISAGAALCPAR